MSRLELSRGMSAFFMEFSDVGLERILCVEIEQELQIYAFQEQKSPWRNDWSIGLPVKVSLLCGMQYRVILMQDSLEI